MSAPVFLAAPDAPLTGLGAGDAYVLGGPEGRHAAVVQRRRAGERVDVVDGRGTRARTLVEAAERDALVLRVAEVVREPEQPVRLVLVQALAKGDRDELAIEAATELGVDAVQPWQAERSVVVWRGDRAAKAHARWVSNVTAAVKQSRRAWLPQVRQVVDTRGLVTRTEAVVAAGGAVLVLHEDATVPLARAVLPAVPSAVSPAEPPAEPPAVVAAPDGADGVVPELLVVVGPEGGISAGELERLVGAGAQPVLLGPHVLRTSTAGPAALALLCDRLGRWA